MECLSSGPPREGKRAVLTLRPATEHETGDMDPWIGLIGVLAGAAIALLGQYGVRRMERRQARDALLLEQCAHVVALSEDYRNRLWEERKLGAENAVASWDMREYRLAGARIRLLTTNVEIGRALEQLVKIGTELGKAWRISRADNEELQQAWVAHREGLDNFVEVAGKAVRAGL